MRSYYEHIKAQSIYYQIFVYEVVSLLVLWIFMNLWGYNYILAHKARNSKNIIEGCAYYSGKSKSKYGKGYYIFINKYRYDTQRILMGTFPSGLTGRDFYKDLDKDHEACHNIKYIEIDLILTKKIFIYDYLG